MALDKLVDSAQLDNNLTSVANAIRAKSGGTGQLTFPAGFVSEIGNISGGGGITPTGTKEITITENGTTTEDVTNYAAAQITVNVPSSGGGVQSGSITPSERSTSISFDCGLADPSMIVIVPHSESPFKSNGLTTVGGWYSKSGYYRTVLLKSNAAGTTLNGAIMQTSEQQFEMNGTTVTLWSNRSIPSIAAGSFEAIAYDWFAW